MSPNDVTILKYTVMEGVVNALSAIDNACAAPTEKPMAAPGRAVLFGALRAADQR